MKFLNKQKIIRVLKDFLIDLRTNIITLLILFAFIIFFVTKKIFLVKKANYTYGVIHEEYQGARGHYYIKYFFVINEIQYKGSMPRSFCNGCDTSCCKIGDTVIVRYEKGNPKNNDLVHKLPPNTLVVNK